MLQKMGLRGPGLERYGHSKLSKMVWGNELF